MLKLFKFLIVVLFSLTIITTAQVNINTKKLYAPFAKTERRIEQKKQLQNYARKLSAPGNLSSKELSHILKELSLYYYRDSLVESGINLILRSYRKFPASVITKSITAAKALYPKRFRNLITNIIYDTNDKFIFAYSSIYLTEYPKQLNSRSIDSLLNEKFPNYEQDEYLNELHFNLTNKFTPLTGKQIISVLSAEYQKGKTLIFSIHRHNREYPGITIIRKPDGSFVREKNGELFNIPQLGLAAGNLPGFMKDGNTPQGILSVVGTYVSPTESIGPTPNVLTRIPFGKSPQIFFHYQNKFPEWNIKDYISLLPESVRDKREFYEAFYAGKFGRRLLVMHGSVDNMEFYKSKNYFPLTPTKGCLSSIELWDSTGSNLRSDQTKLINAFYSTNNLNGFLVVFEIDDKHSPVSVEEIAPYIKEAESISTKK